MPYSEKLNRYDQHRRDLAPYGLTCELWEKCITPKPDRHNEIEINYFPSGSITYLVNGHQITIPEKKLVVFWALVPHQVIKTTGDNPYYVCTIPFNVFLQWNLPSWFVDKLLKGEFIIDDSKKPVETETMHLDTWKNDINSDSKELIRVTLLEMNARLHRLAYQETSNFPISNDLANVHDVEKITAFIAANYTNPIKMGEVGEAVGLHPDYANKLFRQTFGITISEFLVDQRIAHAKRLLSTVKEKIVVIAYESGFNSIGRFNAAFKKKCGCTPKEYRKIYS